MAKQGGSDSNPSVVICGGGVVGVATAYYLSRRGVTSVIVEANGVASGASGAAAGIISPLSAEQARSPLAEIIRTGVAMHGDLSLRLPEESSIDYAFERRPTLLIATTEQEETEIRAEIEGRIAVGVDAQWLTLEDVREQFGWIDQPIRGAMLGEIPGVLDPYRFSLALLAAAERAGCEVRSGRVSGIEQEGGRVTGVRVGDDVIPADAVVLAMGPWSQEAAEWIGTPLPVTPLKGQIVRVRPDGPLPNCGFGNRNNDYVMPKSPGVILLGTTEEDVGFDDAPTREARDSILQFGVRYASSLGSAALVEQTACLRPLSADEMPIVGAVAGLDGAYVATGHGRKGILMSPPTGAAVAELILDGGASTLDLSNFSPSRFQQA
jgi:glycine/D-amino acid oxidase-like deaminating enzyme